MVSRNIEFIRRINGLDPSMKFTALSSAPATGVG